MKKNSFNNMLIYVVDDDPVMRMSCLQTLKKSGYRVETFDDGQQGLERIKEQLPDLLVVDLKMPKIGGMEVVNYVRRLDPDVSIVVITGYATIGTAVEAMKAGAYDFLPKPFTPDELRLIVNRGLERSALARESKRLREEKEKIKRRFITFVSHQLQSPLAAVQQYLDVLKHLKDSPSKEALQEQWVERSLNRIKEMTAIIHDWLAISKIENGCLVDDKGAVPLRPLLRDVLDTYENRAEEKKIELVLEIADGVSPVKGYDECLKMVFSNLVDNAIKYSKEKGTVRITAKNEEGFTVVSVEDDGIGIPQEKLEAVFDEFYRVKSEATRNIPGTGLGLPICRKIAEELGGSIEVASRENEGSIFTVRLPKEENGDEAGGDGGSPDVERRK